MTSEQFVSFAQNGEDVVLWRALGDVGVGTYVEVGGNDPTELSVSRAFYDRGWHGVVVEPVAAFADAFRRERPRDRVVQAAVVAEEGPVTLHQIDGTGLSSLDEQVAQRQRGRGWDVHDVQVQGRRLDSVLEEHLTEGEQVHFMVVDVEGAETDVLASVDLGRWRPWVLVVEATEPLGSSPTYDRWEPDVLAAGYRFCLFDGLSRFYVHEDHAELAPALSYPACALDEAMPWSERKLIESRGRLQSELDEVRRELEALRAGSGHDPLSTGAAPSAAAAELAASASGTALQQLRAELDQARLDLDHWRTLAVDGWSTAEPAPQEAGTVSVGEAALRRELTALQQTLSWRITKPLRSLRKLQLGPGGGR
jgi:FkbM family methyltransferase